MSGYLRSLVLHLARRMTFLVVVILLLLPLMETGARAGYILQSARQFANEYTDNSGVNDLQVGDVTGDGIPDVVTSGSYSEGWAPLLVTLPGLGDGTFSDAVVTDPSPSLPFGEIWRMIMTQLNGDPYPDLILNYDDYDIGRGVATLLGNSDGSFSLHTTLPLSYSLYDMAAGDFTGDGLTDLAIAKTSHSSPAVWIYQGNGDGSLTHHSTVPLDEGSYSVVAGDFDNDGDPDLVCGINSASRGIRLLLNDGSGNFAVHSYGTPYDVWSLAAGDLNNDGYDDLVAGHGTDAEEIRVFFGSAGGTFDTWSSHPFAENSGSLNLGDLDGDGDLDLVAFGREPWPSGFGPGRVCVLLNDGSGAFGEVDYCFRSGLGLRLADMDGDSALDAVMSGPEDENVTILPGGGDGTFPAMSDIVIAGMYPQGVGHADVDGDGDIDLGLAAQYEFDATLIVRNNGDGTFAVVESYDVGSGPYDVTFGDLDGDWLPEMIVITSAYTSPSGLSVMHNAGNGTFEDRRDYEIGASDAALGDLDGDGDLDIAACHSGNLGVLINPGNGIFPDPVYYPSTSWPNDLCLADMDGDNDLDAVVDGEVGSTYGPSLLTNNGDGSFAAPRQLASISGYAMCLGDFDGDGDPDIAMTDEYTGEVAILLNDGTGHFGAPTRYPCGESTLELAAGDIDRDGHLDLVAANQQSGDIVLLRGLGGGMFGPPESYPLGGLLRDISLADFDGDGSLDVLANSVDQISASIFWSAGSVTGLLATGPGRGEPNPTLVRIFPATGSGLPTAEWSAYGVDRWGVNVALGQLDGSGWPEVLTGAGPGAVFGPHVRGFTADGTPLAGVSFLAYGTNKYGVNATCGDLDNDGFDEIITGAGPGAVFGPHVRGWNWDGAGVPQPIPGISYFAYGTPKWGVNVSCGDIDGDDYDEIVTGAGPGAVYGPHVRGWNCDGGGATAISAVSFLAYGTNKYGVNVCCGDIDGDGIDEMVTGAGPGEVFGPHVRAWNWDGSGTVQAIPGVSFFAYPYPKWGVNVSCGDLDDDSIDEILTGPGPGPNYPAWVRGFNYDGNTLSALGGVDFIAYDEGEGGRYGVKVAGDRR